ncbi:MAG TPA: ATP-binding protein [Candidatus Baltobacteraceae bacterium]|nr:ATP-binding protein [Candidatus Baltobacteraceae bacterium]
MSGSNSANPSARRNRQKAFSLVAVMVVLFVASACIPARAQAPPQPMLNKRILVLHAFESQAPVFAQTDAGLSKALLAGGVPLENQFFESLDLRRNPSPAYRNALLEQLYLKYRHRQFDLIVTNYPEALDFVLNEAHTLFPDPPILALYMLAGTAPPITDAHRRIFWHSARLDIRGTLEIALKLVPTAKRVFVVSGAHMIDRLQEERARVELKPWENRLEFRYLSGLPMEATLNSLAEAPPDSLVLLLPVSADGAGKIYFSPDVAQQVSQASKAPVFGVLESSLGRGIVGGALYSFERTGTYAARLALEILRGGPPSGNVSSAFEVPAVPMFDGRELNRWNLSATAVPPGSIIINQEFTLWERYRLWIIAASFIVVVQALLIVGFMLSQTQRNRAERQLAERLRFETLLAELSARFVHLPAKDIETEIQDVQRRICEGLDLDRSTLLQVPADEPGTMRLTHIHNRSETPPTPDRMDMRDFFPWALQKVLHGETVTISTLATLPPEAARDRESLQTFGTKSFVAMPLESEGTVLGALSFAATRAERDWPEDVVNRFDMVAHVIATAVSRSRADQALRESEERLSLAADSAGVGLWILETGSGRFWVTPKTRELFGYASEDPITLERFLQSVHGDDREHVRQVVRRVVEEKGELHIEYRTVRSDGAIRWIVSRGRWRPSSSSTGADRLMGVSLDITERRDAELELGRLRRDLTHMGRTALLGELTASLAHELNQPLTAIAANADVGRQLLQAPAPPLADVIEILTDVQADAERAGEVIQRLRSLLKKDRGRFAPLDLNTIIQEVVALTRNDALIRHQPIQLALAPALPPVPGDRIQLQQVLLNLVMNGMEAMERQPAATRRLVLHTRAEDGAVRVGVRDHGPGIPPDQFASIFDSFFTTKATGMGMGLAISRSIVEAHGGKLWAENNPEGGATFWFALPAGDAGRPLP